MEALFKILVVLCLSSFGFGLRFTPTLNLQSPVSLDVGINNFNSQQSRPRAESEQCVCHPNKYNLPSVINTLDAGNESIERVVVYLYRIKGTVVLFIPSKNKQERFLDLYFDDSEGDILSVVSSEPIVDIFDSNHFNRGQTVVKITEEIVKKTDMIDEDAIQLQPSKLITDSDDLLLDSVISSDDINVEVEENTYFDEENSSIDYTWQLPSENVAGAFQYPQNAGIINIPNAEQFILTPSPLPQAQSASPSLINQVPLDIQELDTISDLEAFSTVNVMTPLVSLDFQPTGNKYNNKLLSNNLDIIDINLQLTDNKDQNKLIPNNLDNIDINLQITDNKDQNKLISNNLDNIDINLQVTDNNDKNKLIPNNLDNIDINLQITDNKDQNKLISNNLGNIDINISSLDDYGELQKPISISPTVSQSPLQQNVYSADSTVTSYITYDKWFDLQLERVVLYNLGTQSKILELRERLKKILLDNGMQLDINGVVTDVNGNTVQMSNIKLRPVLIGTPSDPYSFVNTNLPESRVSYVQLIEVIGDTPPKLLGSLVVGTVYLPRNLLGQNANVLNQQQNVESTQGCQTCKGQRLNPYLFNTGRRYPPITYGNYDGLPFMRNFGWGRPASIAWGRNVPYDRHRLIVPAPQRVNAGSKSTLGSVFDGLLGNLGVTPSLTFNPTRRILTGGPKGPKTEPQSYPNDDLPGFRIVGGNAATSSGAPLANKGRSGFNGPSFK